MATCTTTTPQEPFPRAPTPRPTSTFQIVTQQTSYQSLHSPVIASPILSPMSHVRGKRFLFGPVRDSPGWEHINVISPSTASQRSIYSDTDNALRSPKLALLTNNLLSNHSATDESPGANTLISPSVPVQLPGDELLYNPANEERPKEPFFDIAFQDALAATKKEMKDISLAIWGCPASHQLGSDLHALKQWAQQLSDFEPSRTRTLGIVGDVGVGKSSVINSLLDQPYLANSNYGNPTPTITEYRFRPTHHDEPFSMEVDYMTSEEVKELIGELLGSFRASHIPAFADVDDPEERREIKARSVEAWRTLFSMFGDQLLFTQEFVLEYPSEIDTPLVNVLHRWATESLTRRPGGPESRTWSSTAFNIDECTDKLDAFVRDPLDQNIPALWPYLRVVRVYLRSAILQSGVVLVDCPALRKLNFARVQATERYLRNCHEIFAVTTMDNALSDKGILDVIRRNGQHRPLHIICTKSEDVNPREAERTQRNVSLQVRAWRRQIQAIERQAKRSEALRRHGASGAMEEEVLHRDMLEDMKFGLKKFLVERRNRDVATQLIEEYADQVQLGELKVFCVSNKDYLAHRYDEQSRAEPRLELSGIVNLRKHCHAIPAKAQFEAASAFIEHEVPAFLGSLRQWAVGSSDDMSVEKASEIRELMKSLEEMAIKKLVLPSAQVQITRTNLNHEFAASVVLPIREHRSEWRNTALERSKEWAKWDAKDYAAFCRHHGTHETKATGHRNWNEDILAPMRLQLHSNWGFFEESVEESKREIIHSIREVFASLEKPLQEQLPAAPKALKALLSNLQPRVETIIHIIQTAFADLLEGTSQLESDTLYGHASSYIATVMAPAYHAASSLPTPPPPPPTTPLGPRSRSLSPPKSLNRPLSSTFSSKASKDMMMETITSHIASTRIFPKLSTMVERTHRILVCSVFDAMMGCIAREVDNLVRDFNLVVGSEADLGTERSSIGAEETVAKSEAQRYPEFVAGLTEKLNVAEQRVAECGAMVREVRGLGLGITGAITRT